MYAIFDTHTNTQIGRPYRDRRRAWRRADRLDARYGAVRYIVRVIWP